MSMISMIPLELRKRRTEQAVLTQFGDSLDDEALRELATGPVIQRINLASKDSRGLDVCTREMFSLAMLIRLGKVTEDDIRLTFAAFRRLDVSNEGVLNSKSIIGGMIQKRASQLNLCHLGGASQTRRRPKDRFRNPSKSSSRTPYSSARSATSWSSLGSWINPSTTPVPSSVSGSSSIYPPGAAVSSSGGRMNSSEQVPLLVWFSGFNNNVWKFNSYGSKNLNLIK